MLKNLIKQFKDKIIGGGKTEECTLRKVDGVFHLAQGGKDYILTNLPDDFVIKGNLDLSEKDLTELPDLSKVTVEGDFNCSHNQLTSLKGAPRKVGGDFICDYNTLTILQGAPQEVGGDFSCSCNQLTSLVGTPKEIGGTFYCGYNQLTTLEGAPRKVGGNFYCSGNKLTTLVGAPQEVGGDFICGNNKLTSLEGAPQKVGRNFDCYKNLLTSLEGAPQEVGGNFDCDYNQLTSLKGAPQKVGGDFLCKGHDALSSLFEIPEISKNKKIYCDKKLMEEYNCMKFINEDGEYYINYKNLTKSAKYQSELSAHKIRQKKHEEKERKAAKFKAGYAAFKKQKQTEERE